MRYHYDVSNDFYELWLDARMVYSCGYFETPETDLDTAQLRKLDYVCRKLRLKPGMRLLDIGCGWGGLVMLRRPAIWRGRDRDHAQPAPGRPGQPAHR